MSAKVVKLDAFDDEGDFIPVETRILLQGKVVAVLMNWQGFTVGDNLVIKSQKYSVCEYIDIPEDRLICVHVRAVRS